MRVYGRGLLGAPVVPFYPFFWGVPLLKPNSRKKGTLIIKRLLGNLGFMVLGSRVLESRVEGFVGLGFRVLGFGFRV